MIKRKKITEKVAKYLFLWLPNGYITRTEFLVRISENNTYMREKGLKEFMRREYVEKSKIELVVFKNESYKKDRVIEMDIYALTPKGLICLKEIFSDKYPWLKCIYDLSEDTFFANNSKFNVNDIEHNIISSYLEHCDVYEYKCNEYSHLLYGSYCTNPFKRLIENAQMEWAQSFLSDKEKVIYKNYDGTFYQFCIDIDWNYDFFEENLHPERSESLQGQIGMYVSKEEIKCLLADDYRIDKAADNLNISGIIFGSVRAYPVYYYWNKAVYIAEPYIKKTINVMDKLKSGFGSGSLTNIYGKYSAFVFAKNIMALKHLIEKNYIQNKVSRFNKPYDKVVYGLYLIPIMQEHYSVFKDILNERSALSALCDEITIQRGYGPVLGYQDKRIRKVSDSEFILMGFDLDACVIYKIYEEYQNHDMEQIKQMVDNLPPQVWPRKR